MPSDATEAALGLLGLTAGSPMDTLPTVPSKRKQPSAVSFDPDPVSDTIDCICGFHYDDGFSIGCDACSRWCHAACFGIAESEVPEEWHCWVCRPRPVDKERAIKVQKTRQKAATALALQQKPRTSPGVERKPRRVSAAAIDGGSHNKRKRRSSINAQHPNEDEHVDIDEPWTHSYVPIEKDIVPHDDTRDRLRRVAAHWRGITALHSPPGTPSITPSVLAPDTDPSSSQINLQPLSPASSHPPLSSHVNPSVRPPAYAVHATHSIPSSGLVAPYPSTIIPSAAYLSDPLNAYAHLGMPKPFVHLFGPPLDVALDARITGGQSRFVRSGCRPNTVLRPVLCPRSRANSKSPPGGEDTLTFGIFALRDLKAHEEVVLGWEWDDGSVVHNLPALLESPDMFPAHELQHMRYKMTSLLHTLSSTFTTCACGAQAQDCALTRMAEFVEGQTPPTPAPSPPSGVQAGNEARESEKDRKKTRGHVGKADLGPLVGAKRGFRTRERERMSGGMSGMEMDPSGEAGPSSVAFNDAQTTTDGKRSMRKTSSRKAASQPEDARSPTAMKDHKGKGRADALESPTDQQTPVDDETTPRANRSRRFRDQSTASPTERRSRSPIEDKMPPKMRKHFIHRSLEALRNTAMSDQRSIRRTVSSGDKTGDRMDVDESTVFDARQMPPPPLPSSRSPQPDLNATPSTPSPAGSTSPSIPFANLSLLSPVIPSPPSYFPARRSSSPLMSRGEMAGNETIQVRSPTVAKMEPQDVLSWSFPISRSDRAPLLQEQPSAESMVIPPPEPPPDAQHAQSGLHTTLPEDSASTYTSDVVIPSLNSTAVPLVPEHSELKSTDNSLLTDPVSTVSTEPNSLPLPSELSPPPPPPSTPSHAVPQSPLPPAKVKLSLKDFALRKKKQREEGEHKGEPPSPADVNAALPPEAHSHSDGVQVAPLSANAPNKDASDLENIPPSDAIAHRQASSSNNMLGVRNEHVPPDMHRTPHHGLTVLYEDRRLPASAVAGPPADSNGRSPKNTSFEQEMQLSAAGSLQAKVELVEEHFPAEYAVRSSHRLSPPPPLPSRTAEFEEPSPSPSPRSQTIHVPFTRQVSQEEGEILSPPPPKALPLAPRSYTPPTQPRSFHPNSGPSLPHGPSPPPFRRAPFSYNTKRQNNSARPPSGPRALRNENYTAPFGPPGRGLVGPATPRAPSADREREREREWGRERERSWMGPSRGGRG